MPERTLAAIHDPLRTLPDGEAKRRLAAGLGATGAHRAGALAVAWTGPAPAIGSEGFVVADAAVAIEDASPAALRDLRGGFAVIAWDGRRVLLARDHLGARPLFYATDGAQLVAASEVSVLLGLLSRRPAPDLARLCLWLAGHRAPDTGTLFAGVSALPPAHALVLDGGAPRLERYWTPRPRGPTDIDADAAAARLRDGVQAAVRRHAGPPGERGVLLSGGLDSSTVLACAAEQARADGERVPTAFSATFPGRPELDETAASGPAAAHAGAEWVRVPAADGPVVPEALAYLDRWKLPLATPNIAVFRPLHEEAARRGARVLLDGEGGDELFGCEPLLLADRLLAGDVRGALALAHALPGAGERLDRRTLRVVAREWVLPGLVPPRALAALRRARRQRRHGPPWLHMPAPDTEDGAGWWRAGRPRWRAHLSWLLTDARATLAVQDELRRGAAMGGVTGAHPFLDVDLIETVLALPPHAAFDRRLDRPLLRHAMTGLLPDAVRLRTDKVFFNELVVDALTGPDQPAVDAILGSGRLELGAVADPQLIAAAWRDGPDRYPRGRFAWSLEMWRLFAAETWLRSEAGRGVM
jgi:asparagine synthase (glutamine-hydrolysing)